MSNPTPCDFTHLPRISKIRKYNSVSMVLHKRGLTSQRIDFFMYKRCLRQEKPGTRLNNLCEPLQTRAVIAGHVRNDLWMTEGGEGTGTKHLLCTWHHAQWFHKLLIYSLQIPVRWGAIITYILPMRICSSEKSLSDLMLITCPEELEVKDSTI
jgi:hypothetical protein